MTAWADRVIWGAGAALSFLVLGLAYRILTDAEPPLTLLVPVAILVGIAGALVGSLADAAYFDRGR